MANTFDIQEQNLSFFFPTEDNLFQQTIEPYTPNEPLLWSNSNCSGKTYINYNNLVLLLIIETQLATY